MVIKGWATSSFNLITALPGSLRVLSISFFTQSYLEPFRFIPTIKLTLEGAYLISVNLP